jgi:RIO kinase 1
MDDFAHFEELESYEYIDHSRQAHRHRSGARARGKHRSNRPDVTADLSDFSDNIVDFIPSYAAALDPLHHERQWVINSVGHFYRENIISDVTHMVRGGKEANVYCCDAHPATGLELIAAKLYRPRMLRHLKNDAVYKAGRQLRAEDGKQLKGRRVKLALRKKTAFGKRLDILWWIGNEYSTQEALYEAGADVPKPIAHSGNTILMAYVGDATLAAPTMNEVSLESAEAQRLFRRIMDNVALMLDNHFVHGDLSAYNVLFWRGEITIIDFPQMVDARTNPHAYELLKRDIQRICDYFARFGVKSYPAEMAYELWQPYMGSIDQRW